jgi:hypothetical protein
MAGNYPGLTKKWRYLALSVLIPLGLFAIISGINCANEPEPVVYSQDTEADVNQAPADANEQSEVKDPNDKRLLRPDHNHPAFSERVKVPLFRAGGSDMHTPTVRCQSNRARPSASLISWPL